MKLTQKLPILLGLTSSSNLSRRDGLAWRFHGDLAALRDCALVWSCHSDKGKWALRRILLSVEYLITCLTWYSIGINFKQCTNLQSLRSQNTMVF